MSETDLGIIKDAESDNKGEGGGNPKLKRCPGQADPENKNGRGPFGRPAT